MQRREEFGLFLGGVAVLAGIAAFVPANAPTGVLPLIGLKPGPDTTVITEPLDELGFPDYLQVANGVTAEGVLPEENFWAKFDETLEISDSLKSFADERRRVPGFEQIGTVPFASPSRNFKEFPKLADEVDQARDVLWVEKDFPDVAAWLEENERPLGIAVAASARPKAYSPMVTTDGSRLLIGVLLPSQDQSRHMAKALLARATLRLAGKKFDEAWSDLIASHRIGNHQFSGGFFIEWLVGTAITAIAVEPTTLAITSEPGPAETVRQRWKGMSDVLAFRPDFDRPSRFEHFTNVQMHLASLAGIEIEGDVTGRRTSLLNSLWLRSKRRYQQAVLGCFADVNAALRFTNAYWARVNKALLQPTFAARMETWKAIESDYFGPMLAAGERPSPKNTSLTTIGVMLLSPAVGPVLMQEARCTQRRVLLHGAFVAEIYHRETGNDVTSGLQLQQMAARYAAAADVDCPKLEDLFIDEPLIVRKADGILTIYSVGPNGVDDGGVPSSLLSESDDVVCRLVRADELRPPPPPVAVESLDDEDLEELLKK